MPMPAPSGAIAVSTRPVKMLRSSYEEQDMSAHRARAVPSPHSGLSADEAQRRLRQFGANALPEARTTPIWRRVLKQLRSPLIGLLLFALLFDLGTWAYEGMHGTPAEAIAILSILVLNAGLGSFQEFRSEQALAQLKAMAAPQAWVLRDGRLQHIASADIVPGDLLRVTAGERIPADGRLLEAQGMLIDEAVLTGESVPIDKAIDERALSGTLVVRGKGMLEVSATGANSAMGRLAGMLSGIESEKTPLEKRLAVFGMQIARWVGALAVTLIVVGVAAEGLGRFEEMVLFAVALAVAAVPEGMPAVVTLTLALGVQRMARRKAVVRRLSAVEALGSVTVIATDKTGTLTENRMRVHELLSERRHEALQAMALANDAEPDAAAGDPLEIGLLAFAREQGIDIHALRASHPRVSQRVFDSSWKFMRVTIDNGHELQSLLKGAPEVLLGRCNLDPAARDHWLARAEAAANDGYRVLALAQGVGEAESDLQLLGLILLWDPARAEVADAMRTVRKAGVRVIMITGDHPGTARAVARQIGMEHEHVVTGAEIDALDSAQLRNIARDTTVFARVSAEHKLRLIEALQANGEIVAMTGDGVNDAPALKRADVGIAMGQRGSDVSREVADLVLLDDNFATIVGAIEEGRGIYENIQKFIRFLFSTNVALVILVVGGAILAYAQNLREDSGMLLLPLTAIQLLWINFIADGPPALALALDRNASLMQRPPRSPSSPLLDTASLRFVFSTGLIKAAAGLSLLIWLPMLGYGASVARTAVFLFEASAQLVFAYPARRIAQAPASNMLLNAIVALSLLVQAATLMLPALREMLALHPLDLRALAIVATAVLAAWLIAEWLNHRLRMHAAREAALP